MLKPKRILVDMDDVLCEFTKTFLRVSRIGEEYYNEIKAHGMCDWGLDGYSGEDIEDLFFKHGTYELYRDLPAIHGAVEGVRELTKYHEVVIVTATPFHNSKENILRAKHEWLAKRGLGDVPVISTRDKHLVVGDVLIDDNEHNALAFAYERGAVHRKGPCGDTCTALVFNRPWNTTLNTSSHDNMLRVYDWSDIVAVLCTSVAPDMSQLDDEFLRGMALVFTHGRNKYPNQHWSNVPAEKSRQSLLRHTTECVNGDFINKNDWGLPVEFHIACRAMMHWKARQKGK